MATKSPEVLALTQQLDAAKASAKAKVQMKVSEKGALSLYGMGRFPVTLYRGQWETVIGLVKDGSMEKFITDNAKNLRLKEDETPAEAAARQARVAAYSAEASKRQAEVNASKAQAEQAAAPKAVPPTVRPAVG